MILVIISLGNQMKKLNGIYERETAQKIKTEEELSRAKKQIAQLQKSIDVLSQEKESLRKENEAKEKSIKDLNSQIASLQEEIKKLNRLKDSLEESLKNALSQARLRVKILFCRVALSISSIRSLRSLSNSLLLPIMLR